MNSHDSYPALTSLNVQEEEFNRSQLITIDKSIADSFLNRSQIIFKDVILSYTGEYRRALTNINKERMQLGPNICRIRPKGDINPFYLSVFFNSSFGQALLDREKSLSAQPTVAMSRIRKLKIPQFSKDFQLQIEQIINQRQILKRECENLYTQAEDLLMEEIGINVDNIDTGALQVKSFKKTFAKTGRLDAEYYQGKYDELQERTANSQTIDDACTLKDQSFKPKDDIFYKYIELANIGNDGDISGVSTTIGKELPTRARRLVKKGDVIVSSIEGSLQNCALITDEFDGSLCSTGFYVINSENYNSETLLVLFKSPIVQDFLKRGCSGIGITSITKEEFLKISIPSISERAQTEISKLVQKSFEVRAQSKQFFETAKHVVEVAIEEGEEAGLKVSEGADAIFTE